MRCAGLPRRCASAGTPLDDDRSHAVRCRRPARGPHARRGARAPRGRGPDPRSARVAADTEPPSTWQRIPGAHGNARRPSASIICQTDRQLERLLRRGEADGDADARARLGARDRHDAPLGQCVLARRAPAAHRSSQTQKPVFSISQVCSKLEPTSTNVPSRSVCDTSVASSSVKTVLAAASARAPRGRARSGSASGAGLAAPRRAACAPRRSPRSTRHGGRARRTRRRR